MDELTKAIDKLLNEKTFTVDAVRGIEELRKRAESLEGALRTATARYVKAEADYSHANAENSILKAREGVVAEREKKMTELEMKSAISQAKFDVVDKVNDRLLANRTIRESTQANVQRKDFYSGGGGSWSSKPENTDKTTEER